MSRSGYIDDCDDWWGHIRWRGAVASGFRGKRGQAFLKELIEAMDAMPVKELHSNTFAKDGCHCALGVISAKRGIDMSEYEPDEYGDFEGDRDDIGPLLGISSAMAREIMYANDEWHYANPAERWTKMRAWLVKHIANDG